MKSLPLLLFCLMFFVISSQAQVAINTDGSNPDNSAMLDVKSTARGLLVPRMTLAQRNAIVTPATGLLVFQTNSTPGYYYNSGTPAVPAWVIVGSNAGQWQTNGSSIYYNLGDVGIGGNNPQAGLHVFERSPGYTASFGTPVNYYNAGTNVAIGDDNESSVMYIGQSTTSKGFMIWNYNATPANAYFSIGTYSGNNPLILQTTTAGNVGIGTNTPAARLEVRFDNNGYSQLGLSVKNPNYFYHYELSGNGDGQSALFAYRTRDWDTPNHGTGYNYNSSNYAIMGFNDFGDQYSFGTSGYSWNDFPRSGGIIGAQQGGGYWGSLGYRSSGSINYGGYFTSSTNGGGKSVQASTGIGLGAWGDLMGADIHGKVYGLYAEGENYATYSNGPVYKNNIDVHLQENGTATNTVLYTYVSTDVSVQTTGQATLSNGRASIAFDPAFTTSVSSETPVIVTVTPIGNSNGVYLAEVSGSGFTVVENNTGRSSVTVNFIAIGKRAGYEHPNLSKEVVDAGYTNNLSRGLHNDADTQTDGEGLYYESGKLAVGIHPSTLPDPNRPTVETVIPKPGVPTQGVLNPSSPTGIGEYNHAAVPVVPKQTPVIETTISGSGNVQPIQQIAPVNNGNKDWNATNKNSPEVTPDKAK